MSAYARALSLFGLGSIPLTSPRTAPPGDAADGLLQGSSQTEYSRGLRELGASGAILTARGLLWRAAAKDVASGELLAAYLARVHQALQEYTRSDKLCDRNSTLLELLRRMQGIGQFVELVGARNVGKSHILRTVVRILNEGSTHRALYLNARETGSNLATCILASLARFSGDFAAGVLRTAVKAAAAAVGHFLPGGEAAVSALGGATSTTPPASPAGLVLAFIAACKSEGRIAVIAIDEATLMLSATDSSSAASARDLFALFTHITKESHHANVLFAASGFAESARFNVMNFSPEVLTKVVVASEVPPAEMLALLCTCACGPHLAAALIGAYGGSVCSIAKAVEGLTAVAEEAQALEVVAALPGDAVAGPSACFAAAGPHLFAAMAQMLHALAQDGFYPLDSRTNACAALVRAAGVGGVVARTDHYAGAQLAAWNGPHLFIVVPSSQAMRLILCSDARVQAASHSRAASLDAAVAAAAASVAAAPAGATWWAPPPVLPPTVPPATAAGTGGHSAAAPVAAAPLLRRNPSTETRSAGAPDGLGGVSSSRPPTPALAAAVQSPVTVHAPPLAGLGAAAHALPGAVARGGY